LNDFSGFTKAALFASGTAVAASLAVLVLASVLFGFEYSSWSEWQGGLVGVVGSLAGIAGAAVGLRLALPS
jgi:hypothetical protein